jgi:hypothetical protein
VWRLQFRGRRVQPPGDREDVETMTSAETYDVAVPGQGMMEVVVTRRSSRRRGRRAAIPAGYQWSARAELQGGRRAVVTISPSDAGVTCFATTSRTTGDDPKPLGDNCGGDDGPHPALRWRLHELVDGVPSDEGGRGHRDLAVCRIGLLLGARD